MPTLDAQLRVAHPCPYCDLSVDFPEVLFLLWCDNRMDHFLVSARDEGERESVLTEIRRRFRGKVLLADGTSAVVRLPDFEWEDPPSVTRLAREAGLWVLPPVTYFGGKETYRMLAPARPALHRLVSRLRRLGDVELLSLHRADLGGVRELPTSTVQQFEGITDRQARSLIAAHEAGLTDVPARGRWAEVARREGLSRSTFGEHLRKAQARLVENSYPALKFRARRTEAPVFYPATGGGPSKSAPRGRPAPN